MSNYKSLQDFKDKLENNWKSYKGTILLLNYDDLSTVGELIFERNNNFLQMSNFKSDAREMSRFADLTIYIDDNLNLYFKKQRRYFESYNLNDLASELCGFFNSFRDKKVDLFQFEIFQTLIEIRKKNPKMINKPINFLKYYNDLYKDEENIMAVYIAKNRENKKGSNNLKYSIDLKGELNERNN